MTPKLRAEWVPASDVSPKRALTVNGPVPNYGCDMAASAEEQWQKDPTAAVICHGLLGRLAIIEGAATTLGESWERLDEPTRARLLSMISAQAADTASALRDVVRGLPADALAALDAMSRDEAP